MEVSPAGVSMELLGSYSGGYSAGYGEIWAAVGELLVLARGDGPTTSLIEGRLSSIIGAFSHFRLRDQAYGCLRSEATLSARKNSNTWRCEYSFQRAGAAPAAVALENPDALRQVSGVVRRGPEQGLGGRWVGGLGGPRAHCGPWCPPTPAARVARPQSSSLTAP